MGFVYRLLYENDYFYYGSTKSSLRQRLAEHKRHAKLTPTLKRHSHPILGIECVEEVPDDTLLEREDFYIRQHFGGDKCLNDQHALRNWEAVRAYMREYGRTYYEANKERVLTRQKDLYARKRDELSQKHTCEVCGGRYTWKNKSKHLQTTKHKSIAEE